MNLIYRFFSIALPSLFINFLLIPTASISGSARELGFLFSHYCNDLFKASGIRVVEKQRVILYDWINHGHLYSLLPMAVRKRRNDFNEQKFDIIAEWERNTGFQWPQKIDDQIEAHHIIFLKYNGPNTWWNIYPIPTRFHQKHIHHPRSAGTILHEKFHLDRGDPSNYAIDRVD